MSKITTFFASKKPEKEIVNLEETTIVSKNAKKRKNSNKDQPAVKKQKLEEPEIVIVEDCNKNQDIQNKKAATKSQIIKFNSTKSHFDLEDEGKVDFYPNYLPQSFATELFNELMEIEYEHSSIQMYGKSINLPRVQAWMADENVNASLYQKGAALPWSEKMLLLKTEIEKLYKFKFDYVLINLYRDGKDYISYHSDGESIGDGKNIIAGISLGAARKFVLRHNSWKEKSIEKKEFNLTNGSLIMMIGDNTQKFWKHSVPKTTKVTTPRINLTFRHS